MNFARPIVINTGMLISAAIRPQSVPALALERALLHYDVWASLATFAELQTALLRPKFDCYAFPVARQTFVEGLSQHLRRVEVTQQVTDCADPKDNKFLALALTVNAEMVLASDPHLIRIHPWRHIPILPPAAFLVSAR